MTDYEVYDIFFSDEEYELENAPSELYSYRSGWNAALKRASIVIRNEIRPQGAWIIDGHHIRCNRCNEYSCNTDREGNKIPDNFCPHCGANMRGDTND